MWRIALIAIVVCTLPAWAQPGAISGTVFDSMAGQPLTGAIVRVEGSALRDTTDTIGHFQIAGVPPGSHQVSIGHPTLDSLGLVVTSGVFTVPANTMVKVSLATPSVPAVLTLYCQSNALVSLVSGRVMRADGDEPVPGATVSASWTETGPVGRSTRTDSVGRYHVCVARGRPILLQARLDSMGTGYIPPTLARPLLTLNLHVPRAGDSARATVIGQAQVADSGGPVAGATVSFVDLPATATADQNGRFQIAGLPTGSHVLIVQAAGRKAVILPVDLSARTPRTVTAYLPHAPPTQAPVNLAAGKGDLSSAYDRIGFTKRQRTGIGRFLTADQIQARPSTTASDLVNGMTGFVCSLYVVDGQVLGVEQDARDVPPPSQLIGIEVYRRDDPKPIAPPPDGTSCAEVLVWTKAELKSN